MIPVPRISASASSLEALPQASGAKRCEERARPEPERVAIDKISRRVKG
jgi:hypothetical protein